MKKSAAKIDLQLSEQHTHAFENTDHLNSTDTNKSINSLSLDNGSDNSYVSKLSGLPVLAAFEGSNERYIAQNVIYI